MKREDYNEKLNEINYNSKNTKLEDLPKSIKVIMAFQICLMFFMVDSLPIMIFIVLLFPLYLLFGKKILKNKCLINIKVI
jgi:energy-coupling factor transporter transmembrane protein EcfT